MRTTFYIFGILITAKVSALNVVLPGGTGPLGQALASRLVEHDVTILCRNAFLAAAPNRVTHDFGWVGIGYLKKHPHVSLRDWDGGDLLDIVGSDWVGWQDDTLAKADVVINLVGGFTEQRVMACERLVRESASFNTDALHVTVSPTKEDLASMSPGMPTLKNGRVQLCEEMVKSNLVNSECVRLEANRLEKGCDEIIKAIDAFAAKA